MNSPAGGLAPDLTHTPLQPFGTLVRAAEGADLRRVPPSTLAHWTDEHKVVVLRGFPLLEPAELAAFCESWGELLRWDFGAVLDLHIQQDPRNYLFTRGPVPFHWDGAFAEVIPHYFVFQCVEAPEPGGGGETVFCDTRKVCRALPDPVREKWRQVNITYRTDKLAHYGGTVTWPLLSAHPVTGEQVLRYAEPLPPEEFRNPLFLEPQGIPEEEREEFFAELRETVHRPEFCYVHAWQHGDILIAENHSLIHGRNSFVGNATRRLQRVQII